MAKGQKRKGGGPVKSKSKKATGTSTVIEMMREMEKQGYQEGAVVRQLSLGRKKTFVIEVKEPEDTSESAAKEEAVGKSHQKEH